MKILAEYIWIDGHQPTAGLRSKTRILDLPNGAVDTRIEPGTIEMFPVWNADGSSTEQASGDDSDIGLIPVLAIPDPFRPGQQLVLTEVTTADGQPHPTNHRADLRATLDAGAAASDPMFGFEQEYTLLRLDGRPLGFPEAGYPEPQGPYYCGVGAGKVHGREVYEAFLRHCVEAGLPITGVNWEVMPGQAEVQIAGGALEASDSIWLARWILERTAEEHGVRVSFDPKPVDGDWNGAGMHTNFSTAAMRAPGGYPEILQAAERLAGHVEEHLAVYGAGYEMRLTGMHETAPYHTYRYGVADRTASVRIPRHVAAQRCGYLEDRRPNANADPYQVAARMLDSVCVVH